MTRAEALNTIAAKLAVLDDDRVQAVAELIADFAAPSAHELRVLSDREHALLAQARQDFASGRTVTLSESRARTDALFAQYEASHAEQA
jgi:hypothetical protein